MGRNRSYDEDEVLDAAMGVFRRGGYRAVSIRDLEEATGLRVGSLYNRFRDKAGLFDAAFARYNRTVLDGRLSRYAPPEAGPGGLRRLFLSLLDEPDGEGFGCLITNSAIELGEGGRPHPCVSDGLETLTRAFAARLAAAHREGLPRPDVDAEIAAQKLLALYQGILVLVRAGHDRSALARMIDDEFDNLTT